MNTDLDSRIKHISEAAFRRRCEETERTRLFGGLDQKLQGALLGALGLDEGERPIVATVLTPTRWAVLTTRRLHVQQDGSSLVCWLDEIESAAVDLEAERDGGRRVKGEWRTVRICTRQGTSCTFELEPGVGLYSLLDAIKTAVNLSATRRATAPAVE